MELVRAGNVLAYIIIKCVSVALSNLHQIGKLVICSLKILDSDHRGILPFEFGDGAQLGAGQAENQRDLLIKTALFDNGLNVVIEAIPLLSNCLLLRRLLYLTLICLCPLILLLWFNIDGHDDHGQLLELEVLHDFFEAD